MKTNRIIVAGSRNFTDWHFFYKAMSDLFTTSFDYMDSEIVSGGAKGVDAMAKQFTAVGIANIMKTPYREFPANWELNGRAAGPIRNREMAQYGTHLVAFWDGKSKGTKNMIDEFKKANKDQHLLIIPI